MPHSITVIGVSLLLLAGCTGSSSMYADVHWQLRCPQSGTGICTVTEPSHDVTASAKDPSVQVACEAVKLFGGGTLLNLTVTVTSEVGDAGTVQASSFEIADLVYDDGFAVTGGKVTLHEADGDFVGQLGGVCQLSGFGVQDTDHGRAIAGQVLCRDLVDPVSNQRYRDLTSPTSATEPATFSIARCPGI